MKLSKSSLLKLSKPELVDMILELQKNDIIVEPFKDIVLKFKKNFLQYGNNDSKKYGFSVKIVKNILYISWRKYVPSGFLDGNSSGGSFEIILSKKDMNNINKNGFTTKVVLPLIKNECNQAVFDKFDLDVSEFMVA